MIGLLIKISPIAFGLLGIFLGLGAWATDYCHTLLVRLNGSDKIGRFETLVNRRSFQKYYGSPQLKPIVDKIANLERFDYNGSFQLSGRASETNGTLLIYLDGIGPPLGHLMPAPSIKESKAVHAGVVNPFRREKSSNPRMIKAVAAVLEGVERRMQANPSITKLVFEMKDVVNPVLKSMLTEKMGLKIVAWRSIGLSESAATMRLEIELAPPPSREPNSVAYCF